MFSLFCCHGRSSAWVAGLCWAAAAILRSLIFCSALYLDTKESGKVSHPPGTLLFARLSPGEVSHSKFGDILLVE